MKSNYSKNILIVGIFISICYSSLAQTPTVQDCLGAIPVCQTTYWQANAYSGTGPAPYNNEINAGNGTCLLSGERNDVWYIFTVINSGQLSFVIQPNNNSDDYDWALFNLTNANCADIFTNSGLQVCCNYSATDGATGMYNPPNAGCNASASDNTISPTVGVTAGQTYVLNVSNFTSSNFGYNLNFGASTASIYDNVPPVFQSVNTAAITCGTNQVTFTFSENVLCSSVAACDFTLTGPGGTYTVTGITGAGCAVGGTMENTFTITVMPAITTPGSYTISLVNTCSSVADNCGNLAAPASFNFINTAPGVSVTPTSATICAGSCTSLTANGATSYSWSNGLGTAATVNPCPTVTTIYTVTGTATGCTSTAVATVNVNANPVVDATTAPASICAGQSSTLSATGATSYTWQPGGMSGASISVTPGTTTIYTVTGTTGSCTATDTVTVTVNPLPTVSATATPAAICNGQSSDLTGSGANTYSWLPGSLSGSPVNVSPTSTTTYTVTGTSTAGCTAAANVTVTVNANPSVTASAASPAICAGTCTNLTGGGASTYAWNPGGLSGTTVNVCPGATTIYTVTGTSAAGCTGSTTVTVTVVANPVTTVSASLNPICVGQSTTLTAGGATTYSWVPGVLAGSSVVVSPNTSTTYTVTGTSGNCSSNATITVTVNPTPSLNITPVNPAICNGQSVALTLNSTVALSGCTWNPTTGLTPSNSCNPTANPTVTTTYNVQGQTAQGCTNTTSVTVTVNANPTVTATSNAPNNTICNGQCTQLTATSNPTASTWTWLPTTGLSSTSINNPNACPTANTTYTVTSQTAAGCTGSNTIAIIVNPLPVLSVTPQPANICNGGSIQLNVTGVPALTNCSWTPNTTLTPSTGSCSPTANPTTTTIYTVNGQSAAGCSSSTTATVTVNANPVISVTPASTTICYGSSTTLQANSTPAGLATTWAWLPVAGINPSNSSNPTVNPTTTTLYTVTGTSAATCSGYATVTVTVNPLPVLNFSALPTLCISSPAFILNQASPAGGTYFGTGVSAGTFSPSVAGTGTHTISYTYTDPNTGCSDTTTQTITINAGIPVSITPATPFLCPGGSVTLTASGAASYVWTPPLGINVTTGPVVVAMPPSSIIYTVTGTNADGCSGMGTAVLNYYNTNMVGIVAVPHDGCNPLDVTLNFAPANMISNGTWSWDFGDYYSNINTSLDSTAHHLYQHEGNFIVTFSGMDINGCVITAHTNVDVYIKPHADFYNTPEVGYSDDPTINFVDFSYGANYWMWDFGDPYSYNDNYSSQMNPVHIFSDSGTFVVTMVVISSHDCSDTASHEVVIYPTPIVYIPNAFTPNSDRLNDDFRPIISGFDKSTYKFYIFDRWGREVFFSRDVYTGWDGNHKGKPIAIGVYSYILYFNEYSGKEHKIIGSVTLIR